MQSISTYIYKPEPSIYKTQREEIVADFVHNINLLRIGTKWKPVTKKQIALRLNMNPKLAKDDGECALLLKECLEKTSFSKFFWVCPMK